MKSILHELYQGDVRPHEVGFQKTVITKRYYTPNGHKFPK